MPRQSRRFRKLANDALPAPKAADLASAPVPVIAAPISPSSCSAPARDTGLILANLAALSALGVGISFWVLTCTDWFPVVGGLLGLGGVFAWLAFVSGLLTEDRKKALQLDIEKVVLLQPGLWKTVVGLALAFGMGVSLFGTVELRSLDAKEQRVFPIQRASSSTPVDEREAWILPPFERSRKLVFTGWQFRDLRVRIGGLPVETFRVGPLIPARITVPASFELRKIALVRADKTVTDAVASPERLYYLAVTLDNVLIGFSTEPFRGETVWVGCHSDTKLPDQLIEQWRREAPNIPMPWLSPLSVAEEISLEGGRRIEGWLLRDVNGLKPGARTDSPLFRNRNVIYRQGRDLATRERILEIVLKP
jgi:hypothetical protein